MLKSKNTYFFLLSRFNLAIFILVCTISYGQTIPQKRIISAASQTEKYLPFLYGKKVAIVANQTSIIESLKSIKTKSSQKSTSSNNFVHLVDTLVSLNINIIKVFAPEHGFRGKADAGEYVSNETDKKTGLPIISLHGKNKKPPPEVLKEVDIVLFDIQDVGVRFYTYISTMTYMMEACAEQNIPIIILDRPNPNGNYVDGPTLEIKHKSFVGLHPIPLVYGLTIGEYAKMVNGEKWLKNGVKCDLTVILLKNYTHDSTYSLPIRPSPNLPNDQSIHLYPSLGFFEGTIINAGRGTEFQFQRYGAPFFPKNKFSYTPHPNFGSKTPKFNHELCYGVDLSKVKKVDKVNLEWLIDAYQKTPKDKEFFGKSFTIHAGSLKLRKKIEAGMNAEEIRATWKEDIEKFKIIRNKYLIYK